MKPQTEQDKGLDQQKEPVVPPSPPKSRLPLLLTFVFLVILILVGGYKLMSASSTPPPQPTPILSPTISVDPTANWKTYTSEEFSFKYPPSWYQPQLCKFGGRDICIVSPNIQELSIPGGEGGGNVIVSQGGAFGVTRTERTDQTKLEDVCNPGGGLYIESCQPTTTNGLSTMRRVNGNPEDSTTVFILTDKYLYSVGMNYVATDNETRSLIDQILSTFTFLDQDQKTAPDNWITESITIEKETMVRGKETLNMELKVPQGWTLKTNPRPSNPNFLIKNCSDYVITNPTNALSMTLSPICSSWAAQYSNWPSNGVTIFQQKTSGDGGIYDKYRVRLTNSNNNYNYVDASVYPDKTKDQIMDAMIVAYAPANARENDFYFIPVNLTLTYNGAANEKGSYLSVADQIAASITLR